ncbi:MAG TPA: C39 family peptidase [Anaerolineales bacterium]|nr:C39 family peptidase [Anaerolineales bacterium]
MTKKLAVPYRSQSDQDARLATTDCGAACVAMLLEGFGRFEKIDDIFRSTGRPHNAFLSRGDMIKAAAGYNFALRRYNVGSQDFLKNSIDKNKPFIALVHYAAWSKPNSGVDTQSNFSSAHFVVVTGYDGNDVFIHDPLWWGSRRSEGSHKRMSYAKFAAAWGTAHKFPGNPDFAGLIPRDPMPGGVEPVVPEVDNAVINRVLAWAFINGQAVDAETLSQQEVVDVFLQFMGNWGTNVVEHRVQPGDDLGLIALRYYGDPLKWKVITFFNGLPPINAFEPGDLLKIPEPVNP